MLVPLPEPNSWPCNSLAHHVLLNRNPSVGTATEGAATAVSVAPSPSPPSPAAEPSRGRIAGCGASQVLPMNPKPTGPALPCRSVRAHRPWCTFSLVLKKNTAFEGIRPVQSHRFFMVFRAFKERLTLVWVKAILFQWWLESYRFYKHLLVLADPGRVTLSGRSQGRPCGFCGTDPAGVSLTWCWVRNLT